MPQPLQLLLAIAQVINLHYIGLRMHRCRTPTTHAMMQAMLPSPQSAQLIFAVQVASKQRYAYRWSFEVKCPVLRFPFSDSCDF